MGSIGAIDLRINVRFLRYGAIMQEDIVVRCPKCSRERHMKCEGHYVTGQPPTRYSFGPCTTCFTPFVVEQTDYGQGFEADESTVVYPADERKLSFAMPPIVQESYEMATGCEAARQWMPAAVFVGRTLEAVCHEQLGKREMLAKGLKELLAQGKISKELSDWSDELRFLRNISAHPSEIKITQDDAVDAMNLLQAILETLYHLRPKFQQMKARRAKPGASPPLHP